MDYEEIIEAFDKLSTKEQAEVLAILSKSLYKSLGGKKSKLTGEKKPASAAFLSWNDEVSKVHEEMKKTNPKTTRAEAMTEAAKRRDSTLSPEDARKKADEREKRKAKKEEKKSASSSTKTSKSSSKIASAFASDTESEEEPVKAEKRLKKEIKKKQEELFGSDSESEPEVKPKKKEKTKEEPKEEPKEESKEEPKTEEVKEEPKVKAKESFKIAKVKGKKFIYNPETGAAYTMIDGEDGKAAKGEYVGKFSKSPIPKIDDSVAEEDCTA